MPRSLPRPELADARREGLHNIGEAAQLSGLSAKMIRHYETIGLIAPATRTFANYRLYSETDLHRMRFIKRARTMGFSLDHIQSLLDLWGNPSRASAKVKALAQAHAEELGQKVREMEAMQRTLEDLARHCHGDERPACPILDDLAAPLPANAPTAQVSPRSGRGRSRIA